MKLLSLFPLYTRLTIYNGYYYKLLRHIASQEHEKILSFWRRKASDYFKQGWSISRA
jgi:hypothetical protein